MVQTYVFDSTVVGAIRSECYDPDKSGPGMVVDLHGYTQVSEEGGGRLSCIMHGHSRGCGGKKKTTTTTMMADDDKLM